MSLMNRNKMSRLTLSLSMALLLLIAAGCTVSSTGSGEEQSTPSMEEMDQDESMEEMDHDEEMEDMDHEHDMGADEAMIPNDGATIRIVSPEDHATFAAGETPTVQVEVEGFAIGEEGNHWHIFVDGSSWAMVTGHDMEWALNGLEPGEHEVMVRLANGSHEELEEGDMIMITVEE